MREREFREMQAGEGKRQGNSTKAEMASKQKCKNARMRRWGGGGKCKEME